MAVLFAFVDLDDVRSAMRRFDWRYGPWFVVLVGLIILGFAFRWYLLLSRKASFGTALYSVTVGLGANMVLPARGGDVLRVIYTAREAKAGSHVSVSTLLLEKIIDLLFVATLGILAIALEAGKEGAESARLAATATGFTVLFVAFAALWFARRGSLIPFVRRLFRLARIGPSIYRHAYGPLDQLARGVRARPLLMPMLLTSLLWCGIYPVAYALIGAMVGIPLGYIESLILVFAGAMGLAVPAAPSGLGTFHASILSGFVLLGRDPAQGLVLAVAIHGAFFLALLVPAAAAYICVPLFRNRHTLGKST